MDSTGRVRRVRQFFAGLSRRPEVGRRFLKEGGPLRSVERC